MFNASELIAACVAGQWLVGRVRNGRWTPQAWLDGLLVWPLRAIERLAHLVWRRAL